MRKVIRTDLPLMPPPKKQRHVFESAPFRSGVVPTTGSIYGVVRHTNTPAEKKKATR